jgi:hypothetical protein
VGILEALHIGTTFAFVSSMGNAAHLNVNAAVHLVQRDLTTHELTVISGSRAENNGVYL